jgi:hypothetical protein
MHGARCLCRPYIFDRFTISFSNAHRLTLRRAIHAGPHCKQEHVMSLLSEILDQPACNQPANTAALIANAFDTISKTMCRRLNAMKTANEVEHLDHLIASRAWTDAALALLAIELPHWQLRRLCYDDGEWHCALSNQREMPDWLDAAIEAHHPDMAMAILDAFCKVVRIDAPAHLVVVRATSAGPDKFEPMPCDNYA